ncbi:MAG TPA: hypothetical protein VM782_10805, partial [Stellaceae bacterium]|nr:hypothetical protein [Stellaceae bacterium]
MIEGFVESIAHSDVWGWAHDSNAPDTPVSVALLLADEEIAVTEATMFRQDLLESRKGDGRCGFAFKLRRELPAEAQHIVKVRARFASGEVVWLDRLPSAVLRNRQDEPTGGPPLSDGATRQLIEPTNVEELFPGSSTQNINLKVFIVGPPRSGTSILYLAMQQVFDLPGYGESHVVPAIQRAI